MREMTGEQRCLIHSANRSLEWWDAVGGNVLGLCVEAGAMGDTSPLGKRKRGFPLMHAVGEKSACGMTVRGWAQVWRGLRCALAGAPRSQPIVTRPDHEGG